MRGDVVRGSVVRGFVREVRGPVTRGLDDRGAVALGGEGWSISSLVGSFGMFGTFGTVKLVDGTNVYIQDASGNVIKVTTTPEAAITVSKRGTAADLKAGDTVVVQGTADADGNIAATAITAGGFGGGRQRGQNGGGTQGAGGTAPPAGAGG